MNEKIELKEVKEVEEVGNKETEVSWGFCVASRRASHSCGEVDTVAETEIPGTSKHISEMQTPSTHSILSLCSQEENSLKLKEGGKWWRCIGIRRGEMIVLTSGRSWKTQLLKR